ncbi:MAG: rcc01693 family protein [Amaricoccus sp.]
MSRVDWPGLMRLGLVRLGLLPEVFWALTPAELMLLAGLGDGRAAMTRDGLDALAARFPDAPRRETE